MAQGVRVAGTGEIPAGRGQLFEVAGKRLAVFNLDGAFFAIDDGCTHLGASLAEGALAGDAVICPWHGAQFSLRNGQAFGPPARGGVGCYPCRVEGNDVFVEV